MTRTRGFTLIELLVVISIIGVLIGLLLPALSGVRKTSKGLKDRTQLEQIHTAMQIYAVDNKGVMPVPGLINRRADATLGGAEVPGSGPEDHTLNHSGPLYSSAISMNLFGPEILVGPTEMNLNVRAKTDYNYAAYDPSADSYWDATFTMKGIGAAPGIEANGSYAHMALVGKRKDQEWRDTQRASAAVLCTRGPGHPDPTIAPQPSDSVYTSSPTLLLHGPERVWEGNVCFNDNHVEYLSHFYPRLSVYETGDAGDALTRDSIFACEFGAEGTDGQLLGDNWCGVFKSSTQFSVAAIHDLPLP